MDEWLSQYSVVHYTHTKNKAIEQKEEFRLAADDGDEGDEGDGGDGAS